MRTAGKYQRTTEQRLKAHRGTIFDRDGADLALSVPARTVTANPKLVFDAAGTVRTLTALLHLEPAKQQSLLDAFTAKKNSFVYVARQIDPQPGRHCRGLAAWPACRRSVRTSGCSRAAMSGRSVIGRTDPDLEGTGGLEKEYNDILRGVDGEESQEHDRKYRSIAGGDETVSPIPGSDVVLTLDRGLQYQVEKALLQRVDALTAVGGTAIVMGVNTGDIYSRAPTFAAMRRHRGGDVGQPCRDGAARARIGRQGVQPVGGGQRGSGHARDDDQRSRASSIYRRVNKSDEKWKFKIRDAEPHNDEPMSLRDIIVHSSNIGTVLDHRRPRHAEVRSIPARVRLRLDDRVWACPTRARAS